MTNLWTSLEWADQHGIWNLTSTVILIASAITGAVILFWAKHRVRNLNFYFRPRRNWINNFPLVIHIEIRNFTGRTVVISNPYFNFERIRPDPNARGDSASGDYEIKFPRDRAERGLDQVEYMLRHGESVGTWIPLDASHTDSEVEGSMATQTLGTIKCTCTWLMEKPKIHRLKRKIGRPTIEPSVQ